ncbi:hypothetical protein MtrunA17_Chr3g0085221 [Medicago truncatula]|uniref:Transmembrane protein n=1 Tax=Medicago truncatula TaxID=3880 RepID=A0A396ISL0_MEDTR|nr:hypothetical protein MtrunA17_Chr3g0085221 [Medicago truncatula]
MMMICVVVWVDLRFCCCYAIRICSDTDPDLCCWVRICVVAVFVVIVCFWK